MIRCAGEPVTHRDDESLWGNSEAVAGLDAKRGVFSRDSCAASAPGADVLGGLSRAPDHLLTSGATEEGA